MKTLRENDVLQDEDNIGINELLKEKKKLVSFVGSRQSGTTYLINVIGRILARRNIDVAILDMTYNRPSYYFYTENKEATRISIRDSFKDLSEGKLNGILIEKNLTIYTDIPGEIKESNNAEKILETLLKNHQLVLIDTDFTTNIEYFAYSQQVFLVQTMDLLILQQLTEFLSQLKTQNVINDDKIRIILNKYIEMNEISVKQLIGALAFYNDPTMSYMQKNFEKNGAQYTTISYNQQAYVQYLCDVARYEINIDNFSVTFKNELERLADDVANV